MKKVFLIVMSASLIMACNNSANRQAEILQAKQKTIDSMNTVAAAKQRVVDSMKTVAAKHEERAERHAAQRAAVSPRYADAQSANTTPAAAPRRKGWSSTAKGAVIGAGAGAVAGAIIDKKHGEGAVVGGLIGAGAGAATGAIIDHNKKKKQQQQQQY